MQGAIPSKNAESIYPHDYYLPSELKKLRNLILDSEITDNLRTFLRGRTFSRPRGVRRFVSQIQSSDKRSCDNVQTEREYAEIYHQMYCVPKEELTMGNSNISKIIFMWRNQIGK